MVSTMKADATVMLCAIESVDAVAIGSTHQAIEWFNAKIAAHSAAALAVNVGIQVAARPLNLSAAIVDGKHIVADMVVVALARPLKERDDIVRA